MSLGHKVISSLRWLAIARFSGQLISWAVTLYVIRILSPEDYGLLAEAMLIIGLLTLINEIGLGAAIIQRKALEDKLIDQIFTVVLCLNLILYTALFALSPLVAWFFGEEHLVSIIRVSGISLLIGAFSVVPSALLSKRMDFRRKSLVSFFSMLASSISTLFLALSGFGVWALVAGSLVASLVLTVGFNFSANHWCKLRFDLSNMREIVSFGGLVTIERILWYAYSQFDTLIVGKILGKESLGYYSVAKHLASLPMQKVAGMINEVGFAAFSRVQDDLQYVGQSLVKALRMLGSISLPVFFGISCVAPELVEVVLGKKWLPAIFPIQMISLVIPIRMMAGVISPALTGIGRPDVGIRNVVAGCMILPPAFLIGSYGGLFGVALVGTLAYLIHTTLVIKRSAHVLGTTLSKCLFAMRNAALASSFMYLVVLFSRHAFLEYEISVEYMLLLLVMFGALFYVSWMLIFHRKQIFELISFIRS